LIAREPQVKPLAPKTPWKAIFTNRNAWLLFLSAMTCGYLVYIYMSWFYVYLVEERKLSLLKGSVFTTGPFIAMSLMTPVGGILSDRLTRRFGKTIGRRAISMSGMIISGITLYIGVHTPNINVAIIGLSVGAGAIYFALAAHWATTIDVSKEHAGTVSGIMNWGGNMGGMVSPILTPILVKEWGWKPALDIAGAIILCGAFIWLLVEPERPLKTEEA
jgi:ACS family glucarate transporter-like MFS transporter